MLPFPIPEYTKGCGPGVKIALILDASGSINDSRINGGTGAQAVRDGLTNFINEINDIAPGTEIGIVEFGYTADTPVPFTAVTSTSINDTFLPYINSEYYDGRVDGTTNWEAAFRDVELRRQNINSQVNPLLLDADAIIFATDGNPNSIVFNDTGNDNFLFFDQNGIYSGEVNETVPWTNILKQSRPGKPEGTHIYGFGIAAPNTNLNVLNFAPLTDGPSTTEYDSSLNNAASADYAFVTQFSQFGRGLIELVGGVCGKRPNISLVKRITAVNPRQFSNERSFENYYVDVRPSDDPDNAPSDNIINWPW